MTFSHVVGDLQLLNEEVTLNQLAFFLLFLINFRRKQFIEVSCGLEVCEWEEAMSDVGSIPFKTHSQEV